MLPAPFSVPSSQSEPSVTMKNSSGLVAVHRVGVAGRVLDELHRRHVSCVDRQRLDPDPDVAVVVGRLAVFDPRPVVLIDLEDRAHVVTSLPASCGPAGARPGGGEADRHREHLVGEARDGDDITALHRLDAERGHARRGRELLAVHELALLHRGAGLETARRRPRGTAR